MWSRSVLRRHYHLYWLLMDQVRKLYYVILLDTVTPVVKGYLKEIRNCLLRQVVY